MVGGQVARVVQVAACQARPLAVPLAAVDAVADHPQRIAKAVVGAARSVLGTGAAKFAHDQNHVPVVVEILAQLRDAACQIGQVVGELAGGVALVGMGVPAASGQKADGQAAVIAHQGAQVLCVQHQAHRVGGTVAGRQHLRALGLCGARCAVFVQGSVHCAPLKRGAFFIGQLLCALHAAVSPLAKGDAQRVMARVQVEQGLACAGIGQHAHALGLLAARDQLDSCIAREDGGIRLAHTHRCGGRGGCGCGAGVGQPIQPARRAAAFARLRKLHLKLRIKVRTVGRGQPRCGHKAQ